VVSDDAWITEGMVQRVVGLHGRSRTRRGCESFGRLSQNREVTPNEFAEMLGESQQNVSKHLKTLAHRRRGRPVLIVSLRILVELPHLSLSSNRARNRPLGQLARQRRVGALRRLQGPPPRNELGR
jgi:hypothetical protein